MASKQDKQLQEITKKLEEGVKDMLTSENYTEYLKVMSQIVAIFHMVKQQKRVELMGKKKSGTTKTQRKEIRLQKARQWILTYNGSPKHMAKHYRKRFHVDITTAVRDLQEI